MPKDRLYLFDTTLRDGAQTQGVSFSLDDKHRIAALLDGLGLDYIEGGYPGANPVDTAFFDTPPKLKRARLTAFATVRRPGRSTHNDPGLADLFAAKAPAVCMVAKIWDYHVHTALETSLKANLEAIGQSVEAGCAKKRETMLDAEHFFDGYKANPAYAMRCLETALEAGARWIVLCDTNGGTLPHEVAEITKAVCAKIPGRQLGIHAHNDTGNAIANTLAAVRAGVRQVQGTLNGLGERCGNADLVALLPTLLLKPPFAERLRTGLTRASLKRLTPASRLFDEILNRHPNPYAPYVGAAAFTHKGGIHVSAVLKDPRTYEHIPPEAVGNRREIPASAQAGRATIAARLKAAGIKPPSDAHGISTLLQEVKAREQAGYAYDSAQASFEILAARHFGRVPDYFRIVSFRVIVERRINAKGALVTISEAVVKIEVDGRERIAYGEGNGPIHALDQALRADLGRYSKRLADMRLADYKVRILNTGTEATTQVLVESRDARERSWFTVGVSPNIVDASFQALVDAVIYKLMRDAPRPRAETRKNRAEPKRIKGEHAAFNSRETSGEP